jgi:hypothetical protein
MRRVLNAVQVAEKSLELWAVIFTICHSAPLFADDAGKLQLTTSGGDEFGVRAEKFATRI